MKKTQNFQRYSYIYSDLVKDQQDFIGLVAYSLYKQEKIKHVKDFEVEHGRPPQPSELKPFHDMAKNRLEGYTEQATNRVTALYENIYKEKFSEIEKDYQDKIKRIQDNYNNQLLNELKKSKEGWIKGTVQSLLGSIIGTVCVGIIVIAWLYSQHGLSWLIQDIIKNIQPPISIENNLNGQNQH